VKRRLTDTEKWHDPWFRRLPPDIKLFWVYLCESCDGGGEWTPDLEAAEFFIGTKLNVSQARNAFGNRVQMLPSGKWHLTDFVAFQNPRRVNPNGLSNRRKEHRP